MSKYILSFKKHNHVNLKIQDTTTSQLGDKIVDCKCNFLLKEILGKCTLPDMEEEICVIIIL